MLHASPLSPEVNKLLRIIHVAQQNIARQRQPANMEKGLDLITAIKELIPLSTE